MEATLGGGDYAPSAPGSLGEEGGVVTQATLVEILDQTGKDGLLEASKEMVGFMHQAQTEKSLRNFLKKIAAKYSSMKGEGEGEALCYRILQQQNFVVEEEAAEEEELEEERAPSPSNFAPDIPAPSAPTYAPAAPASAAAPTYAPVTPAAPAAPAAAVERRSVSQITAGMNGYIFSAKTDTFNECLERKLLGAPAGAGRDIERHVQINRTVLFLHNMSTKMIYGAFLAVSDADYDIEPEAWAETRSGRNFKRPGSPYDSPFPMQVRFTIGKKYRPLPISELTRVIAMQGGAGRYNARLNVSQTQQLLDTMLDHQEHGPNPDAPRVQGRGGGNRGGGGGGRNRNRNGNRR